MVWLKQEKPPQTRELLASLAQGKKERFQKVAEGALFCLAIQDQGPPLLGGLFVTMAMSHPVC